jgi:hypothetical protein
MTSTLCASAASETGALRASNNSPAPAQQTRSGIRRKVSPFSLLKDRSCNYRGSSQLLHEVAGVALDLLLQLLRLILTAKLQ